MHDASVMEDATSPDLRLAGRTLVAGGFRIEGVVRNPGYVVIFAGRWDEFGVEQRYAFILSAEEGLTAAQVGGAETAALDRGASPVFIALEAEGRESIDWPRFLSLFGGPVFSASPLDPSFRQQLVELGKDQLPHGMQGRPDDLFEAYVRVALEYLMWGKVIRYGQERSFERRPDGIVLRGDFSALYDAKAAGGKGYDLNTTSTRQFADYVRDFSSRYGAYIPRFHAFIVVSSAFKQKSKALTSRSRDLQAECGVPMAFLTSGALMDIIDALSTNPAARGAIPWKRIALDGVIDPARVKAELEAVLKDGIIPPASRRR